MTTTSPLKAVSSAIPPELFGDSDKNYAEKYQNAKEAEDKLMKLLEQRNEARLSPSMLALAGAFFDPGRTGNFGESLGRAATAYSNAQNVENQQLQENAMARMQLANMQLERAQSGKMYNMAAPYIKDLLGGENKQEILPEAASQPSTLAPASAPVNAQTAETLPPGVSNASATFRSGLATAPQPSTTAAQPITTAAKEAPAAEPTSVATAKPLEIDTSPDIMINGRKVNPQIIAGLKMLPATRATGEALDGLYKQKIAEREFLLKTEENRRQNEAASIKQKEEERAKRAAQLKEEDELRAKSKEKREAGEFERGAFKTTPWGYMDVSDPKNPKPVYISNPGEPDVGINFPEFNGESLLGSKEDLMKLREARKNKDAAGVEAIYNYLRFGVSGKPVPGDKNTGQIPAEEKAVKKVASEQAAKSTAEAQAKETQDFLKNEPSQRDTVFVSARIMKNASENSKMYGLLKKPGIGSAIAQFARDRGEVGEVAISKENIENFLRLKNINTKDTDMTAVAEMSSDLARLHFNFRKQLLEKQGQVSDREDMGIAKIQGTPSDTPEYLIKMAQLTGRKAQFDTAVSSDFRAYRRDTKNPYITLDEYKSDPKSGYQKLLTGYESWLTKTYNLPKNLTQSNDAKQENVAPLSKKSLDAILEKRKLNKQKQE